MDSEGEGAEERGEENLGARRARGMSTEGGSGVGVGGENDPLHGVGGGEGGGGGCNTDNDNISDMLLYLETFYRGKLMHMLLADIKAIVIKLHDDDNKAAALVAQKERARRARQRVRAGYHGAVDASRSSSVVAAREKIMEAEQSSRRLMARMYVTVCFDE